jgi:RNA recognition motif-containing protein
MMKIFVANFDEDINEDDLEALFGKYGPVTNVTVWFNERTNRSQGFGFVETSDDADAERAIERLNGRWWNGRRLINFATCHSDRENNPDLKVKKVETDRRLSRGDGEIRASQQ